MLCQFQLYNKVNQLYVYTYLHISSFLHLLPTLLSHPSRWSQSTKLISLCYQAASHQLSILHLVVYICPCHSLTSSQLSLPTPRVLKSIFYGCVFIPVLHLGSSEQLYFFPIYMCQQTVFVFLFLNTSLCMTDSSSIDLTTNNSVFLLFMANIPLYICATSSLLIHLLMDTQVASRSWLL